MWAEAWFDVPFVLRQREGWTELEALGTAHRYRLDGPAWGGPPGIDSRSPRSNRGGAPGWHEIEEPTERQIVYLASQGVVPWNASEGSLPIYPANPLRFVTVRYVMCAQVFKRIDGSSLVELVAREHVVRWLSGAPGWALTAQNEEPRDSLTMLPQVLSGILNLAARVQPGATLRKG